VSRCGLDLALLLPQAWELPYTTGVTLKMKERQTERKKDKEKQNRSHLKEAERGGVAEVRGPRWVVGWAGTHSLRISGHWRILLFYFILFFCFLGPHLWHMEFPRLGVTSELQLPAYTTATTMQDPSRLCDLYHSSWPLTRCQILNPLSKARDRTATSWFPVRFVSTVPQQEPPLEDFRWGDTIRLKFLERWSHEKSSHLCSLNAAQVSEMLCKR